jgi:nucleotide-binding universal stress UspA family protein
MKILIAYDGSAHANAAIDGLPRAGLARQCEALVVSIAHPGFPEGKHSGADVGQFGNPWKATMKEAEGLAEEGRIRVQACFPGWSVSSEPLWGDPSKILLKTINVWKPDLVVVGSHGRSVPAKLLLGSVSTELVHHAPCSVRVVRGPAKTEGPIRVLIATDGSEQAEACVDMVARRSWPDGTRARVLAVMQSLVPTLPAMVPALEGQTFAAEPAYQVIEKADERERVRLSWTAEANAERLQRAGLTTDSVIIDGDPRREINAEAERWHADSVFVGARGLGALDRLLLGSVSSAVVNHAHCAIEIVRKQ